MIEGKGYKEFFYSGRYFREKLRDDNIAGMTDDYTTRMYEKVFVVRHGSIFDKV